MQLNSLSQVLHLVSHLVFFKHPEISLLDEGIPLYPLLHIQISLEGIAFTSRHSEQILDEVHFKHFMLQMIRVHPEILELVEGTPS